MVQHTFHNPTPLHYLLLNILFPSSTEMCCECRVLTVDSFLTSSLTSLHYIHEMCLWYLLVGNALSPGPEWSGTQSSPLSWETLCSLRECWRCERGRWGRREAGIVACFCVSLSVCCPAARSQWTSSPAAGQDLAPQPSEWWCTHRQIWRKMSKWYASNLEMSRN